MRMRLWPVWCEYELESAVDIPAAEAEDERVEVIAASPPAVKKVDEFVEGMTTPETVSAKPAGMRAVSGTMQGWRRWMRVGIIMSPSLTMVTLTKSPGI